MATAPAVNRQASKTIERVPPQDIDAEMALLGAMMMSREAVADVIPIINRENSEWFYLPAHQKIFELLLDVYDDPSKAIDLIVISDVLRRRDLLDFIGGQDYLIQLAESFADWANTEYYAEIVRDKGMLRDLIRCAHEISDQAYNSLDEAKHILEFTEQRILAVTEKRVRVHAIKIEKVMVRLAQQLNVKDDSIQRGLPTGLNKIDAITGGLQKGDLIVIAARPSMGKTALGLTIAINIAKNQIPVALFSMEMSQDQVAERALCAHKNVDMQLIRNQRLSEKNLYDLLSGCNDFNNVPLFIDDTPGMTSLELRSKARRMHHQHNIQAVVIDYLQLMYLPKAENRQVEIATISRSLKSLARELNIPIIALAQLNRMPEGRSDKKPLLSDLRESGAIEQDADVVMLIHREEYYRPDDDEVKNQAEIIIAKQRNGPTGNVKLYFNKKITHFDNLNLTQEPYTPASDSVPF